MIIKHYSKYVELRKERQEKQIQSKKNQDKQIQQTKMLIEKLDTRKTKPLLLKA